MIDRPRLFPSAHAAWVEALKHVIVFGDKAAPRGMPTREVLNAQFQFPLACPVIVSPARKVFYRFYQEGLWIIDGDDRVATIAPYNKHILAYSDNGETFFGAYGPKLVAQLPHVIESLARDRDTRQAVINIWRESPPPTKDVPCTLSWVFTVRHNLLNVHSYMRSNDLWLGTPYDLFNFSLIGIYVATFLNRRLWWTKEEGGGPIGLGRLYHTVVSCHLYERDLEGANAVLAEGDVPLPSLESIVPEAVVKLGDWDTIRAAVELAVARNRPPNWVGEDGLARR